MRPGVWLGLLLCIATWQFAFAEEAPSDADTSSPDPADAEMYGPTTRHDTLWSIARAVRPPGMTLPETVSALQRMNPHAFVEGDPNVLMRGVMLQVPTSAAAAEAPTDPVEPEPAPTTVEPPQEVSFRDVVPLPADDEMDPENLAMRNAELEDRLATVQVELDVATDKIQALESQITTMRRRLTEGQEQRVAPQSRAPTDVAKIPTNVITGIILAVLLVGAVVIVVARSRRGSRVTPGSHRSGHLAPGGWARGGPPRSPSRRGIRTGTRTRTRTPMRSAPKPSSTLHARSSIWGARTRLGKS